jgi:predicted molibdopterin-dependent oxidoreductase YjgC
MAKKLDIMQRIAEASKSIITGVDEKNVEDWVRVYIMGKAYDVPADSTILTAIEYAGYRFIRGCGCRQGHCGACATVFRKRGEYKLQAELACQTRVEDGMELAQIPFTPAPKAFYDISKEKYDGNIFFKYYPELARCVSCNTCTKSCPQDLEVMDYIQAAIQGDFATVANESFDCIQCGMCALRCPAEIIQYHVAQLGRRLYGRYGEPEPPHLTRRVEEIKQNKFEKEMQDLVKRSVAELKKLYSEREKEKE